MNGTALTAEWMKTPRTLRDLMQRLKSLDDVVPELRRLKAEGHDVVVGTGFEDGSRQFYWVMQGRDTKKQKCREMYVGALSMHNMKEFEG
jgi:hypothetical protein